MKEVDEDAEEDESGEDDDEENGSCEENGGEKPVVKRDGTMVATAAVRSSTLGLCKFVACCLKSVFADPTVHSSFRREKSFWRTPATLSTVEHVEKPMQ